MKIIVITGQTATGKTSLALEYAQKYNGELINCDSRQIYKYLNIITGKDLIDDSFQLVHSINSFQIGYYTFPSHTRLWLYDIVDPKQYFSSFDYTQCAQWVIQDIVSRGKTPILVGGTYFYIKHLLYGVETATITPDWEMRKELAHKSVDELQQILQKNAPEIFTDLNNSDRNNPQRLIRKIEIATNISKHLGKTNQLKPLTHNFDIEIFGINYTEKEDLKITITKRVEERINQGAVHEIKSLISRGYSLEDPGLKTIGYAQLMPFVQNNIHTTIPQAVIDEWITKEVQYAKRQLTFMKKDPHIQWKYI